MLKAVNVLVIRFRCCLQQSLYCLSLRSDFLLFPFITTYVVEMREGDREVKAAFTSLLCVILIV